MVHRVETPLGKILRERILGEGPMTFRDFMDQALFHPELGFYSKGPEIGSRDGTFNTNAMFPAFAFCLARAVEQAESIIGEPLRIVELGAGTGELGTGILSFLPTAREYVAVEPSSGLQHKQKARGLAAVKTVEDLSPRPSFVFGNEVLDALPVHRVMNDGQGNLMEFYVSINPQGGFEEILGEPSTSALSSRLQSEGVTLGRGQMAEVCLELDPFIQSIASIISKGYLIFLDYGDEALALYHYTRRNGSLRCYFRQQQVHDPFNHIGEQDITADVDFTALDKAACCSGLGTAGQAWQGTWLKNLGIHQFQPKGVDPKELQNQIEQLTNPARLGSTFDVWAWRTPNIPLPPGFS
ncbi:class I SAM-dependent methyltransferase [Candidatus Nitronereus thalassa]|uniref:SAM-dependent methyltransferase n=1 Tax=Candidatus Nitronereus thalassa TaxID=3020898 RepID=A0ABU3KA61_9BACT|nr:SAM-dependent methyltransferase [Candidatus Nitronereus thalassa]MDT7043282.1 SAM-dependent methyltransferase [Candidatus Nitronereus thalassa]